MPWLLLLHIAGLVGWCALLMYLPVLIPSATGAARDAESTWGLFPTPRFVFALLATPAALLAIVSGTGLFLLNQVHTPWLVLKLTAVSGMVVCHTLFGVLILRQHDEPTRDLALPCALLGAASAACIAAALWLVLAKPDWNVAS
jgi:protoporphyrinogen IX oxidase